MQKLVAQTAMVTVFYALVTSALRLNMAEGDGLFVVLLNSSIFAALFFLLGLMIHLFKMRRK